MSTFRDMLSLSNVRLGDAAPLHHDFPAGAITVVLGRNNSGKTRLARLIAGLETSAPGSVRIDGEDVSALDARERRVGLVYQAFVNYPNLTVQENIASPMKARGLTDGEQRTRARELAERLRIDSFLDRLPSELSGGQQQRLAIARALAQEGRVLVMDEPLVNLDYKLREELELELRELLTRAGIVVIYNTTDPRDAFNLGDEVVLLSGHALLQTGSPLEVYRAPVDLAAADLMSDPGVNLWRRDGQAVAVRPEHLRVQGQTGDVAVQGRLTGLETNGAETFLHCAVEAEDWVVRLAGMHNLPLGEPITLFVAPADILQFNRGLAA